ncbi:cellular nucleic acid-binding protein [Trifolium pratense]|uniref:Cellular nucleic acid-binding protein n=1 Tax=Trifolium pratense TaxID=57577 RepID=A0A2K3MC04_TRIPR|nr:cellular nucleic acid-binding protein [Trifolium pratense]
MAGRNDQAIANALTDVAQAIAQGNVATMGQQNIHGTTEENRVDRFTRQNPSKFKGKYDPDGAQEWIDDIERIFRAMICTDAQKVMLATHVLVGEAEHWWRNTHQRMEAAGTLITWNGFKTEFLRKYFPLDVRNKKEMEFLSLAQGSMSVGDYSAKFEALIRFCPHYNTTGAEVSKCVKFENGLRPEIKQFIAYRQIRQFPDLVDACRIYEETSQARSDHYKAIGERKHNGSNRGKPYDKLKVDQEDKQKATYEREISGGGSPSTPRCFRCGAVGHKIIDCKTENPKCFRCGKSGHFANECRSSVICYNCWEPGHISTQCDQPKKTSDATPAKGKVFALCGTEPDS